MVIGTCFLKIISFWWQILIWVALHPLMLLKVSFLWFFTSFAMSYIFFLVVHKVHMVYVRKELAVQLARSLATGYFVASLLVALYQFILCNVMNSKFFSAEQGVLQSLDLFSKDFETLYQQLCFLTILLSGLFATQYVGEMLEVEHKSQISDRYGWTIMAITFLCCGFLWVVNYIF